MNHTLNLRRNSFPGKLSSSAVGALFAGASVCFGGLIALTPSAVSAEVRPLAGSAAYQDFMARFLSPRGRIVDTGNGCISHSEGQGYGMLFAVAFDDRPTFDRLWKWTRQNLQVRKDKLLAWRWIPTPYGGVVDDPNNATDGDMLVAWALLHAGRRWSEPDYIRESEAILTDIERYTIVEKDGRLALLPGASGFTTPDGLVLNLSYYIFPAMADFADSDKRRGAPWTRLIADGRYYIREARFGEHRLPANWVLIHDGLSPAPGKPALFGYDAVRIPLYLSWYDTKEPSLDAFLAFWSSPEFRRAPVCEVALGKDKADGFAPSPGTIRLMNTVGSLVRGSAWARIAPASADATAKQDYYSSALGLLSQLASGLHRVRDNQRTEASAR